MAVPMVIRRLAILPLPMLMLLASCEVARPGSAVAPHAERWIRTDLFFGLTRRDSSAIPAADFQAFVDQIVTPAFPDGFTITAASGEYLDARKILHREPSRVLTVLYPRKDAGGCDQKIQAISAAYCRTFDQESVLRSDSPATAAFISAGR